MDVATFTDAAAFQDAVRPVIDREPIRSNIIATVLDTAVTGHPMADSLWLLITDDAIPVAAGMHTPPFNLFLSPLPDTVRAAAIERLVEVLAGIDRRVPGITADVADARAFAEAWHLRTGRRPELILAQRLYQIEAAPSIPVTPGVARPLAEADIPLASGWIDSFTLEATPEQVPLPGEQVIRRRLTRGWFLIWEDGGEPVSLAGLSRPCGGVARVGPVYTPGLYRGRGYAGAVVAAVTRLGFAYGAERCMLYADLANPSANGIYQRLGYQSAGEAVMIGFS